MSGVTKGRLRKLVRETLAMSGGYAQTEEMLMAAVNDRVPGALDLTELREAREWNHGKEYLRSRKNEDTDDIEYLITEKGLAKEEVS